MTDRFDATLIITTKNRKEELRGALRSTLEQQGLQLEVIVIDDGSTDGTPDMVRRYGDRVRLVEQANAGEGAARNSGIRVAKGKYLALLDSDDLWFPWTLETFAAIIEQVGDVSFISSPDVPFEQAFELSSVVQGSLKYVRKECYLDDPPTWNPVNGVVLRRGLATACGGFAEHRVNFADADMWLRMGTAAGFVRVESALTSARRFHGSNASQSIEKARRGGAFSDRIGEIGQISGGPAWRWRRQRVVGRHVRPVAITAAKRRRWRDALALYGATFWWHVRMGPVRFAFGLPLLVIGGIAKARDR